jgi:hypothetical protein
LGVCAQYPAFQTACGCPFKAGEVDLKDINYPLPEIGDWKAVIAVSTPLFSIHLLPINYLSGTQLDNQIK